MLKSIVNTQKSDDDLKQSGILEVIVETAEPPQSPDLTDEENRPDNTFVVSENDVEEIFQKKRDLFCKKCNVQFYSIRELRTHQKKSRHYHRIKNYTCSYCSKPFKSRDHLNRHVRTHTKEKPYHCTTCGMNFSMVQNLRRHEKLHTGERPFKCDVCGKGKHLPSFITFLSH